MMRLLQRGLRFAVVGVVNTAVGLLTIYAMMYLAGASVVVANVVGYSVGLATGFTLNRRWTFENGDAVGRVLPAYLAVVAIAYLANLAVVLVATRYAVNAYAAQLLGVVVYSALMFLLCHFWVFNRKAPMERDRPA
jgi:putative flippase GtrA